MEHANPGAPTATFCPRCKKTVEATDAHCRHCGKKIPKPGAIPWAYTPAGIIVLTLTILGPISIGLVWRSPALSRREKWIYSAAIGVLTAFLLYLLYWIMMMFYQQWKTLNVELDQFN